jgi:hypothetical protein
MYPMVVRPFICNSRLCLFFRRSPFIEAVTNALSRQNIRLTFHDLPTSILNSSFDSNEQRVKKGFVSSTEQIQELKKDILSGQPRSAPPPRRLEARNQLRQRYPCDTRKTRERRNYWNWIQLNHRDRIFAENVTPISRQWGQPALPGKMKSNGACLVPQSGTL